MPQEPVLLEVPYVIPPSEKVWGIINYTHFMSPDSVEEQKARMRAYELSELGDFLEELG